MYGLGNPEQQSSSCNMLPTSENSSWNHSESLQYGNVTSSKVHKTILVYFVAWFSAISALITFIGNGLIVFVYVKNKDLQTPFNGYIANIAITETLYSVTAMPYNFIWSFVGYWPYTAAGCTFFVYIYAILGTGMRYSHALVAANRIWAVTFPLSYRTDHTKRVAFFVILITWLYLQVLAIPVVARARWHYKATDPDPQCRSGMGFDIHAIVAEFLGYDVPLLFIVISFPYILFKINRARSQQKKVTASGPAVLSLNTAVTGTDPKPSLVRVGPAHHDRSTAVHSDLPPDASAQPIAARRSHRMSRSHNLVLVYFVIGVTICWTPNQVYFLIVDLKPGYWDSTFDAVQFFLGYIYSIINPVLCYLALGQLRQTINQLVFCRKLCSNKNRS